MQYIRRLSQRQTGLDFWTDRQENEFKKPFVSALFKNSIGIRLQK